MCVNSIKHKGVVFMPRGVQKSIEERIAGINKEIEELSRRQKNIQMKIKDLEAKKQSLLNEKKQSQLAELAGLLEKSNLSPEEVIRKLTESKQGRESA
jgi:septal ring factor EnvC (AmiA/AmiB activator)